MLARARAAELRGELAQAATLFAEAGRADEAARVMILCGRRSSFTMETARAPASCATS